MNWAKKGGSIVFHLHIPPHRTSSIQGTSVDSKLGASKGKDPLNGSSLVMERGAPILDISTDRFGQCKSH